MKTLFLRLSILLLITTIFSCNKKDEPSLLDPIITEFTIPEKNIGDNPFELTPPKSTSTGEFSYSSSNKNVATISGNTVTIVGKGITTISATQAATENFTSGKISSEFIVTDPSTIISTLYVSTTGNDSNNGSRFKPFLTINKAAEVAVAGDIVVIKSGTYYPTSKISPSNSGTSNNPITYLAEVKGEVIIDGSNSTDGNSSDRLGLITIIGVNESSPKSWIVIDGLTINNAKWAGIMARYSDNIKIKNCHTKNTGASGIIGANSSNITVLSNKVEQACYISDKTQKTNECITMASVASFEVAYNIVSDRLLDLNIGGEGIDAKNSCSNGKIHHNTVFNLFRLGLYVDAYSKDITNVEVYANTVYNCSSGIIVASEEGGTATDIKVYDNLVYNIKTAGIRIAGYLNNGPLKNISIYQNTVVRCGLDKTWTNWENCGLLVEADNPENTNFIIRNNIFAESTNQIRWKNQSYATIDNNIVNGATTASGTNAITGDPLFKNSSAADFMLTENSPAKDKAVGEPMATIDLNDYTRDSKPDLGAFEYH